MNVKGSVQATQSVCPLYLFVKDSYLRAAIFQLSISLGFSTIVYKLIW